MPFAEVFKCRTTGEIGIKDRVYYDPSDPDLEIHIPGQTKDREFCPIAHDPHITHRPGYPQAHIGLVEVPLSSIYAGNKIIPNWRDEFIRIAGKLAGDIFSRT